MNAKRVLVIGGSETAERFLLPRILKAGYCAELLVPDAATATAAEAVRDCDVVVHLADIVDTGGVVALEKMLTTVQRYGRIDRWIHISSMNVYRGRNHWGSDETAPLGLPRARGAGRALLESEWVLRRYMHEWQFPAVILRPGLLYGTADRHPLAGLIQRLENGSLKMVGRGDRLLNNTYAGNLADAILLAIQSEKAVGEIFNIRDSRSVTRSELVGAICEHLGQPMPAGLPEWLSRLAVVPGESLSRLRRRESAPPMAAPLPSAPVLSRAWVEFMTSHLEFSIDKAVQVLGYQSAMDFREAIGRAMENDHPI